MYKVILVEDEIFARQGLRNLIDWHSLGYEVSHEADDGEAALRIIEACKPELVITDIRMPELDGLGLIRAVKEMGNTETKFIIISGYGDFNYAQQAIKYDVKDFILKPIDEEELTSSLVSLAEQIRRDRRLREESRDGGAKALERLVKGQATPEELAALAAQLPPAGGGCCCLLAELNDDRTGTGTGTDGEDARPEPSEEELGAEIARAATELGLAWPGARTFVHRPGIYGLLVALDGPADRQRLADTAGRLARRLEERLSRRAMVYAGEPAAAPDGVRESYKTACAAMDYKFACAGRAALAYADVRGQELRYEEFEPSDYARLLEQMEEGKREELLATVDWMFRQFEEKRYAPEAVQNAIARFVFSVIGTIRVMQGDENALRSLEPILHWRSEAVTALGLKERLMAFVLESAEMAAMLRKNNAKGDIAKIKSYIEQHYSEEISLKSIAARFYMNPVYLGQLFKKSYGMYFNDFVLQLRIHEAKRLLRQTEKRVYEIAQTVGFDNADYFVCKFEKVEGRTPTAYRSGLLAK